MITRIAISSGIAATVAMLLLAGSAAAPGSISEQDDPGRALFLGKGNCHTCHGKNGKGTGIAPNLTDTTWLHIDGSAEQIAALVKAGVARPKKAPAPMPPRGGAKLSDDEVEQVAKYVVALSTATDSVKR